MKYIKLRQKIPYMCLNKVNYSIRSSRKKTNHKFTIHKKRLERGNCMDSIQTSINEYLSDVTLVPKREKRGARQRHKSNNTNLVNVNNINVYVKSPSPREECG